MVSQSIPLVLLRNPNGKQWWLEGQESLEFCVFDDHLREVIANTYGQLALIDHSLGRILIELETQGLADNIASVEEVAAATGVSDIDRVERKNSVTPCRASSRER